MRIGFFDSGIGGLFVLRHVAKVLPEYHYVFLGDTENVPYGEKSDEEIYDLVQKSLQMLFEQNCSLVIFACNTASVTALRKIQDEFLPAYFPDRSVLGMIIPTVEEILTRPTKSVAIIATERTIRSKKYEREILTRNPSVVIHALATPTLVPLIEGGNLVEAREEAVQQIKKYLLPFTPDTLVLGCTHYGLLRDHLEQAFPHLRIISQERLIPKKLQTYLERHPEIETRLIHDSKRDFFLTKITPIYQNFVREHFGDFPLAIPANTDIDKRGKTS